MRLDRSDLNVRHPRTLQEAFPHTPEYGAAISVPYKTPRSTRLVNWILFALYVWALWVLWAVLAGPWRVG